MRKTMECGALAIGIILSAVLAGEMTAQVQMEPIKPAPRGPASPPPPSLDTKPAVVPSIEQEHRRLRERVAKLEAENQKLTVEINRYKTLADSQARQIQNLDKQIAEFTRKGGSLVRAYCENDTTSRNTAGARSACLGYRCEPVSGLCRTRCSRSDECASGHVCDPNRSSCVLVR